MGGCDCSTPGASHANRESPYAMVEVDDAVRMVLKQVSPLETIDVTLENALGYVVAAQVLATAPVPPFRASIMDGYAVVSTDGLGQRSVVQRIAAGDELETIVVKTGEAAYITTGSPVPEGADAVVKIEDTDNADAEDVHDETAVIIRRAVTSGTNIREIGSDIQVNEVLMETGDLITPAELGLLATAGIQTIQVYRRPVIGVLSTGSELVDATQATSGSHIRDSNRPVLLSILKQWGNVDTLDCGICSDKKGLIKETVEKALEKVDVLITSGGVSMGDHDLIKPLLADIGTIHFGRLLMKPGKPTTFATVQLPGSSHKKIVFGLPGNPVSCFTTCHLLVRPAALRLNGIDTASCVTAKVKVKIAHDLKLDPERPEYHRAYIAYDQTKNEFVAQSTGGQRSSRLLSCHHANGLLELPKGSGTLTKDSYVMAIILNSNMAPMQSSMIAPATSAPKTTTTPQASEKPKRTFRAALLTVSDRVSRGEAKDLSGPAMADEMSKLTAVQVEVVDSAIVPDEKDQIQEQIKKWTDTKSCHDAVQLILTSGGTGFSPRDVTPEAIKPLLEKDIPGFVIQMLTSSLQITPKASLSRPIAGIRGQTIIISLPGKPNAVRENLSAIESVLPHALHLVCDAPHEHHRPANYLCPCGCGATNHT